MLDSQNITLSLPKVTLKRAKIIAATRETSVSAIMRSLLEEYVKANDEYESAQSSFLALLESPVDMGTKGRIAWKRGVLHERG